MQRLPLGAVLEMAVPWITKNYMKNISGIVFVIGNFLERLLKISTLEYFY